MYDYKIAIISKSKKMAEEECTDVDERDEKKTNEEIVLLRLQYLDCTNKNRANIC